MDFVTGHNLGSPDARCLWSGLAWDNSYSRMPQTMHGRADVRPLNAPRLLWFNTPLAQSLGLDRPPDDAIAAIAGGCVMPIGAHPIQGRTAERPWGCEDPASTTTADFMLGEHIDPHLRRHDLALAQHENSAGPEKGALSLRTALHQFLMGEALNALGIKTPRILAIACEEEEEDERADGPRASVIKVGESPLTIGAFEYAYRYAGASELERLADYAIARVSPELMAGQTPYTDLLHHVCDRLAVTAAQWESLGFVHGRLDTQLTPIDGSASVVAHSQFIAEYDFDRISHPMDAMGRYAFCAQPIAAHWNLCRLANSLRPLIEKEQQDAKQTTEKILDGFFDRHESYRLMYYRHKLGLFVKREGDETLIDELLRLMHSDRVNQTFVFRQICQLAVAPEAGQWLVRHFSQKTRAQQWVDGYRQRLASEPMSGKTKHIRYMASANPNSVPSPQAISVTLEKALGGDLSAMERFLVTHGSQ